MDELIMDCKTDFMEIFDKMSKMIEEQAYIIYKLIDLLAQHISVEEASQLQVLINAKLDDIIYPDNDN